LTYANYKLARSVGYSYGLAILFFFSASEYIHVAYKSQGYLTPLAKRKLKNSILWRLLKFIVNKKEFEIVTAPFA
jgi:hypothetical protein